MRLISIGEVSEKSPTPMLAGTSGVVHTPLARYCPVLATEPEGRIAALVDFTFNLGAGQLQMSTLRRRVNQREWAAVAAELHRWVYGGGVVLSGLVIRREAEVGLVDA